MFKKFIKDFKTNYYILNKLREHCKKINCTFDKSMIDYLIEQHLEIRANNQYNQKLARDAWDAGEARAFKETMDNTWIKIDKLKTMTLEEINDLS